MNPLEIILQLLSGNTDAADPRQPPPPPPQPTAMPMQPQQGMGSGSLRDRMLMEQRARQLSAPGGMGY